jgi:Lipid A 3-O-deacylase (PagL)
MVEPQPTGVVYGCFQQVNRCGAWLARETENLNPKARVNPYLAEKTHFLKVRVILLLSAVFHMSDPLRAQQFLPGFGVEGNVMAGKVIKHSQKFTLPIPALTTSYDVNFLWKTYGRKPWHKIRHYPVVGFGLTYINYGINDVYGQSIGLYTDVQMAFLRRGNWEWTFRAGDGIGYISKHYQTTAPVDTVNVAIGTHINDFGIFMTDLRYHINNHIDLQAGAQFTHMSNGDYRNPNLGINVYGAHVGFRYAPVTSRPKHVEPDTAGALPNRWYTELRAGIAYNEARTTGNPELPTYILSICESRRLAGKDKIFIGTYADYSVSTYAFLKHYGVDYGREKQNAWDGAVFAGNEFLVGHVGILLEMGVYYRQTFLAFVPFYERFGGNYYLLQRETGFLKSTCITARLLTHGAVAQYVEFGLGVGF